MTTTTLLLVAGLLLSLALGIWVFVALIGMAMVAMIAGTNVPILRLIASQVSNSTTSPELLALPLFILMAEILFRTRVAEGLFRGLAPWTANVPGRLVHVNVLACGLFAAVCGSSAATTATVGRITLAELGARGYPAALSMGSLAGAGTLGFLIPPSLILIIYGVMSETSILDLFLAGFLPGVALALVYAATIALLSWRGDGPDEAAARRPGWQLRSLADIGPLLLLIAVVIGSMYGGWASPTEAAVVGVFGSLAISAAQRCLTPAGLAEAVLAAVRTSSMMGLLLAAGAFLSIAMGYIGLPQAVAAWIASLALEPLTLIAMLFLVLLVLGCFLDGTSILIMTLPITIPLIVAAGFDKIWFGIFLVLAIELAQITPPIGFNLFVIQGLTGTPITRVALHALPFFIASVLFTVVIVLVPEVVLFLPRLL